ncbi:hypothetical protein EJ08DRAFT_611248 [Tothia fuscella]|uniref:Cell cycle control protein cwf19 n=1 Tax=Tothia fuscella TaxID=1048955 RepID=A0A9P4NSS6_9PEZI|nr:hypothetical protein EJ08DRAFT_611248 [Tothia fuscella]
MGLSDFERNLAESKPKSRKKRERSRSRSREGHHSHSTHSSSKKHHHRSSRHEDEDGRRRSHKRSRHSHDKERDSNDRSHRRSRETKEKPKELESTVVDEDGEDDWVEKESFAAPPNESTLDELLEDAYDKTAERDAWMEAPSSMGVDYVQRRKQERKPQYMTATLDDHNRKIHKNELVLGDGTEPQGELDKSASHDINYEFGDSGSAWRMMKLKGVYREAEESKRPIDEIAIKRLGGLREFDDAREEETELDRRSMYGKGYLGKLKPSGELFEERKLKEGIHREATRPTAASSPPPQGQILEELPGPTGQILDQTGLNKLKAQMMKAKLKKDPKAAALEAEYNAAVIASADRKDSEIVVLNAMDNRMLASGRAGETIALTNKRGLERGLVMENEDMSIEDMVRQERRTRNQGEGMAFAERIAKDAKFDNDLDYMDENAAKLSKHVQKSTVNLRSTAIGDFQKMNKILDNCPLCHHEDKGEPPIAPILSLATGVYLTLPTAPEISEGGACIIPIQHRTNLLECDDDEWEEIRNFMKSLTRMYHDQGRSVLFYENAAFPHKRRHAAMSVIPLPYSLGETAPAFFKEAILSSDEEWSQHKKLIDTLAKSKEGMGKSAFRRTLIKEAPYFHVWFTLDGGLGHVVEDGGRWPKGDLFAREVMGGMLDVGPDVVKKQGRWIRNDKRVEGFRKRWRKFDWTRVLTEG